MPAGSIVIIGAGVAGLTAAFRLRSHQPIVLEASDRLGGQVQTEWSDGFVVERGAEGFVARSRVIPQLASDLGLPEDAIVDQLTLRSYAYDGRQLVALPPGEAAHFLAFQVAPQDLGRGIRSMRRGMGSLVLALRERLQPDVQVRLGAAASAIEVDGAALRVRLRDGGELVLAGVNDRIRELLKTTALDTLWALYSTRREAMDALGGSD